MAGAHDERPLGKPPVTGTAPGISHEESKSVQERLPIKGTRNGLLLTLEPGEPFSDILSALARRLAQAPTFFRGASLAIDTSRRALQSHELAELQGLLARYDVAIAPPPAPPLRPGGISSAQDADRKAAGNLAAASPARNLRALETGDTMRGGLSVGQAHEAADSLLVRRTIRSGQSIRHHSNVIIVGDVNPAAEVIAAGDVIVWGALRGVVHAGYPDNDQAVVCALALAPVQLRIGEHVARAPEGANSSHLVPEIASIKGGQIVVEGLGAGRPGRRQA
jgi:septum site-determining protein MinC